MGNCFSANDTASLRALFDRSTGGPPEAQLTADMIKDGLTAVAQTLHKKGLNIIVVAVGGATRSSDVTAILSAADTARKTLGLEEGWLNNHTAVFIEEGIIADLYKQASEQNAVVFKAPGLMVYAAPWHYALATKLDRLSKSGARDCDLSDAVAYLGRLVATRHGRDPVKREELKAWAERFKLGAPTDGLLNRLAAEYKRVMGEDGVAAA